MSGSKPRKHLSEEGRQKLRELAIERHAKGEFGGAKFGRLGGRPRKARAAKKVAEAAQDERNAQRIIRVFKDAVHESQPMGIRLQGAKLWIEVERDEAKIELQEDGAEKDDRTREQLIEALTEKLSKGPASKIIQDRLLEAETGIVDATVVEDEDAAA